jgi:integrase/recombinase XerD
MSQKQVSISKKEFIIHPYDRKIASTLKLLERELSGNNFNIVENYDKELVNNSLAKATRLKHLQIVLNLSRMIKKDWTQVTKQDIADLVYHIMQTYSDSGQENNVTWDHKKILKIFFRWFKLGSREFITVGDPEETKSVKLKPVKSKIVREQLLTEDDLKKLLVACKTNPRDRAMIDVHYEAGTRPGELLSLKIKHVKFDNFGAVIHVDGKTGPRPVRLVRSTPNLAAWIDVHPFKENPEAPLWIILDKTKYGEPVNWATARAILMRACERAKLSKRVNLKLFRHSEATNSAKYFNEAQMRMRHGWTPSSKMPANYVHLVNADVDEAYLKHCGIKTGKEEKIELPKICHICRMPNSIESDICNKCGKPLDLKKAIELEDKMKEQNFMANKLAGKFLVQMLMTGEIPKIPKTELDSLIRTLNL